MILGAVGKDAELRYAPNGDPVLSFSVASTKKYKTNGELKENTIWVKCTIWGSRAEKLAQYILKGTKVLCIGELVADENGGCRTWQDKEGRYRASFEMRVGAFEFAGSKQYEETEQSE